MNSQDPGSRPSPPSTPKISRSKFSAFLLQPQAAYVVKNPFTDYDRIRHEVGERWIFQSHSFLPYEDGLSLFVLQDGRTRQIRLQCRPEEQDEIVDNFSNYVSEE